ncbi:3-deoxy-7-phosphoheptulonate synthase [Clostridium botulinum A2B7 92]|uniref:3-deoxy-7-phosphoheptulonate synthase n=1 Tax=Clostridium botulinum TaxID=1491 RepID=UPI0007DE7343|nr:3-deoxy-7-phosphoheptulonate synthase [Clostridium botulinum]KEJ00116.1 3-deoxy-7-phosphoheptulonate synthase [Clostridium botulinum A2B7 92]
MHILIEKEDIFTLEKVINYFNKNSITFYKFQSEYHIIITIKAEKDMIKELEEFLYTCSCNVVMTDHGILVDKQYKDKTIIDLIKTQIGSNKPVFISGPCSIESYDILFDIASQIGKYGANILRGGAFKPRTSPYNFQGLGLNGLKILHTVGKELNLPVISEIMSIEELDSFNNYVDIIQVGCRNMQNYSLLKELGKTRKPILLKRGFSSTIKELLLSAEYIMMGGNENVILCERGIRSFESWTRNTFDVSAISLLKNISHLPVIADPSHATGKRELILPMSLAAIAAGADGLMIESHSSPDKSYSDSEQAILPSSLGEIIDLSKKVYGICHV